MNSLPVLYAFGVDLLAGALLFRCWLEARAHGRRMRIPFPWVLVAGLVNAGAWFAGPQVEKAVAAIGGVCLVVLLCSAIAGARRAALPPSHAAD